MSARTLRTITAVLVLGGTILIALVGLGQTRVLQTSATLSVIGGHVEAQRVEGMPFQRATDGMLLRTGTALRTGPDARAVITFQEGSTITLEPSTQVVLDEVAEAGDGAVLIRLRQTTGRSWSKVQPIAEGRSRFYVRTPSATALVRGTAFEVSVSDASDPLTTVSVFEGKVDVVASGTVMPLPAGRASTIRPGERATASRELSPPDVFVRFGVLGAALMTVTGPDGLTAGQTALGAVSQIPRSAVARPQDDPLIVDVHDPKRGEWELALAPWAGGGEFTVIVNTVAGDRILSRRMIAGTIRPGQHLLTRTAIAADGVAADLSAPVDSAVGRAKIAIDHPTRTARRLDLPRTTPVLSELPPSAVTSGEGRLTFLLPPAVAAVPTAAAPAAAPAPAEPTPADVPTVVVPAGASPVVAPASPSPVPATSSPAAAPSPLPTPSAAPTPRPPAPPRAPSSAEPRPTPPAAAASADPTPSPSPAPALPLAMSVRVPSAGHPLTAGVPLTTVTSLTSPLAGPITLLATIGGIPVSVERSHLINGTLTVKLASVASLPSGPSTLTLCATDAAGTVSCGTLALDVRHGLDDDGASTTAGPKATTSGAAADRAAPADVRPAHPGKRKHRRGDARRRARLRGHSRPIAAGA